MGHDPRSQLERYQAEGAARRIRGVIGLVNEIKMGPASNGERSAPEPIRAAAPGLHRSWGRRWRISTTGENTSRAAVSRAADAVELPSSQSGCTASSVIRFRVNTPGCNLGNRP